MLKRKDWPSNPYLWRRGKHGDEVVTVIAFAITPTGQWAKTGSVPRFHAATAYRKDGESAAEATLRAVEHWYGTQRTCPLPKGYSWSELGIY